MMKALFLEICKFKRSPFIWVGIAACFLIWGLWIYTFFFGFERQYDSWVAATSNENPWSFYIHKMAVFLCYLSDLFLVFLTLISTQLEDKNKTWDRMLALPIRVATLSFSKAFTIYAMVLLLSFVCITAVAVVGGLFVARYGAVFTGQYAQPNYGHWVAWQALILPKAVWIHFWLALKCRGMYALPFFTGLLATLLFVLPYNTLYDSDGDFNGRSTDIVIGFALASVSFYFTQKEMSKNFSV